MKTAKTAKTASIGDRICIIRAEFFDNDNKKLAQVAEIDQSNMSRIINGTTEPSARVLRNILAKTPNLSPDWLLFGVGDIRRVQVNVGDHNAGNVAGVNNGTMTTENSKLIETVHSQQQTIEKLVTKLCNS